MNKPEETDRPLTSVIIVNFNSGDLLTQAVLCVLSSSADVEVLIIDNNSTDTSLSALRTHIGNDPQVHIHENDRNTGFSKASNQALEQASGEYALFLNPDCLIRPDTLARMIEVMDADPDAGMAGPLICNPDGTEQAGCRRVIPTPWLAMMRVLHLNKFFPKNPLFQSFVLTNKPVPKEPIVIEAISGAFMFARRKALQEIGLMDEDYFLHCEDIDLCMRFNQTKWKILFVPDVIIMHYKGTCSYNRPVRVLWHKHKGMVHFYQKFFRTRYPLPLLLLVNTTVWIRFALLLPATLFSHVFKTRFSSGSHAHKHDSLSKDFDLLSNEGHELRNEIFDKETSSIAQKKTNISKTETS